MHIRFILIELLHSLIYHEQEFVTAREATPTERIAQLETARMGLLRQKAALERKIEKLEARGIGKKEVEKT